MSDLKRTLCAVVSFSCSKGPSSGSRSGIDEPLVSPNTIFLRGISGCCGDGDSDGDGNDQM